MMSNNSASGRNLAPAHPGGTAPIQDREPISHPNLPASGRAALAAPASVPYQLLLKPEVLAKLKMSRSTLHAKLDARGKYFDPKLPRPVYFAGSRRPRWSEVAIDAYIAGHFGAQSGTGAS